MKDSEATRNIRLITLVANRYRPLRVFVSFQMRIVSILRGKCMEALELNTFVVSKPTWKLSQDCTYSLVCRCAWLQIMILRSTSCTPFLPNILTLLGIPTDQNTTCKHGRQG